MGHGSCNLAKHIWKTWLANLGSCASMAASDRSGNASVISLSKREKFIPEDYQEAQIRERGLPSASF